MKVAALIAVLLFIIVVSVEAIDNQYPGFQVVLPPISTVSNHPSISGTHNRWNRNLRVCGKTPRWFLSDVVQCVETPSNIQYDCYYMGWEIPLTYMDNGCQEDCCCPFVDNCCIGCGTVDRNGYCYYGCCAYYGRSMPNFSEVYNPYDGDCNTITNPSDNCARVKTTSEAVMKIEGGSAIRSTLPAYVKKSGVRVEMDLAYGFASDNGQYSPVSGISGDIRVDMFIVQSTTATTNPNPNYQDVQFGSRHGVISGSNYPVEGVDAYYTGNYRSTCDTLKFNFPNIVLDEGQQYSIYIQFYNAFDGTTWWADAGRNWGSDIVVSSIRVYEGTGTGGSFVPCYVTASTVTSPGQSDTLQREASYLSEYAVTGYFIDATPLDCNLCNINGGRGYCTADTQVSGGGGQAKFIDNTFDINLTGVTATGGYLILYGANFDDNNDLTLIVNGNTWFSKKKSTVNAAPVNGIYYFCSNCQQMVWPFDNVDGVKTSGNSFQIYTSSDENLCVAGFQFVFTTKDNTAPTNIADGNGFCTVNGGYHTYNLSPSSPKITSSVLNPNVPSTLGWYYTPNSAQDNCETYSAPFDVVPDSLSITYLDVWDYEIDPTTHATQVLTVKDHNGNKATCKSYVTINLVPPMINYPSDSTTLSITNIIIRWENYTPILDATTSVKIWITPVSGCGGSQTVVLGDNISYLSFQYYYRGPTKNINVNGCNYTLYVEFTDGTGNHDPILFRRINIFFVDLNAPIG